MSAVIKKQSQKNVSRETYDGVINEYGSVCIYKAIYKMIIEK